MALGPAFRAVVLACVALLSPSFAAAPGNIGACYSPFHLQAYPLHGERLTSTDGVRAAIEADFKKLSKHFTHIRTYYSQYLGIDIAPIAAANNIKLYLGVFLTNEDWGKNEVEAAVRAVKQHPGTIQAIMVGSENLINFQANADTILSKVGEIKAALGEDAGKVKFGTAQRVTEYLDEKFNSEMAKLTQELDILGVNIYPFFTSSYDPSQPAVLLDQMWNNVAAKYPAEKLRVTETGFATAGSNPSPNVKPSLENAVGYYEGLLNWVPKGGEGSTKFWFQAYDLRADDKSMGVDFETHFGFFTADGQDKKANFPYTQDGMNPTDEPSIKRSSAPVSTPAAVTPVPTNSTQTVNLSPATTAPTNGLSFDTIGKDDVSGKVGDKTTPAPKADVFQVAPSVPTSRKKGGKKKFKDCHAN